MVLGTQPELNFDGEDQDIARRVRTLDRYVHEQPELFLQTLRSIGSTAFEETISREALAERKTSLTRTPAKQLTEYITQRYDLQVEYDSETESALEVDEQYLALLSLHKSQGPSKVYGTGLNKKSTDNSRSVEIRNLLRFRRLEFYLERMATFALAETEKPETGQDTHLPSTA